MTTKTQTIPAEHDAMRLAGTEADADAKPDPQPEATRTPPTPTRGEKGYKLDVPVKFGTVSISDSHAAISAKVGKAGREGHTGISINTAERYLCGARLDVAIELEGEQEHFDGMEPEPVYGICDVKSFSVTPKQISFRLKFPVEGFNYSRLSKLANLNARLKANRVSDADDIDDEDDQSDLFDEEEAES